MFLPSINLLNHIQLINGVNFEPIPLDFTNKLTTTEMLCEMQNKINNLIDNVKDYNGELDKNLELALKDIEKQLNEFVSSCDYNLENCMSSIINHLDYYIEKRISENVKLFQVGINEDGYFYIDTPSSFNEISFDTNENNELIIKY